MSTSVTLPALGESVTEGTVSRWLKQVGDTVEADEPLLEVSTDKVDTEIPSPISGVLLEIKAQEDETVEVGAVLAVIGDADEAGSDSGGTAEPEPQAAEPEPEPEPEPAAPAAEAEPAAPTSSGGGGSGTEVTLPALGESVTEGTVSRWLKKVGDSVAADEALLEVSTDKVDTEIPSPTAGTLLEIRVQEDETVEVGAVLAVVGEAGAASPEPTPEPEPEPKPEPKPNPSPSRSRNPSPSRSRRPRPPPPPRRPRRTRSPSVTVRPLRRRRPPPRCRARTPVRIPPATSPRWSASWRPSMVSISPR